MQDRGGNIHCKIYVKKRFIEKSSETQIYNKTKARMNTSDPRAALQVELNGGKRSEYNKKKNISHVISFQETSHSNRGFLGTYYSIYKTPLRWEKLDVIDISLEPLIRYLREPLIINRWE